ncbi:DUF1538 domain-containing protein [Anaerosalibacter bizertensis]|uniref:DUF1538 domain-containing protein n=1 Tax=Anaerosalibacter bizertensis TaxID=932217 RepID=A0A844FFQ3_9FIRM|nr:MULTISPECIES: DUF1538 domain-containing protein [Bacillota]MBV1819052.1 DUF1538 domain-containing protein [Bacteroidales bacterium MSK.15.36]HHV25811.1 DUF1538 domain-containing protein [Tissierellia bacterium]MBU5293559.1 DUF1538 domain-containing protein [Anaerosalibacter bizertensis]MCB5560070.1 DUF1538 domain-containing protein [Anaerosalibacter bizertensis]MCG4565195.1 DUF1538 domain-containing protein [Anaerosalibacter bizertensis]
MKNLEGLRALWETARSVIPISAFLLLFQILILKKPIENVKDFVLGFLLSVLGLHFFLKGVSISLIPLGDSVGKNLIYLDHRWIIIVFAFVLGYFATLVEPGLKALALEVEEISIGAIPNKVLIQTVAIGFGGGMALGIFKILNNIPNTKIIMPILFIILILVYFAPDEFVAIAMDSASSTTGPVNIPLNMAVAIGLSKIIENSDPLLNGFGIVGLTSLGAVISVLTLGILAKF